jgi:RPAP1-like, C-terminal
MQDLLDLQESFKTSNSSSVKIKKKSLFAQRSEKLKFTDTVSTSDTLFDGVLAQVVEKKENTQDLHIDRIFQKNGFPSAFHRSQNATKFGVQPSQKTAKVAQYNTSELDKLQWTFSDKIEPLEEKNKLSSRFNFSGKVMQVQFENDENSGLYHHGIEHTKPGYTISEFVHLSKSTVPAQRVIALQSLTFIIQNLYAGYYKESTLEIYQACREECLLLTARIGMDSTHSTVIDNSLLLISTFIGCSIEYLELYDNMFNTIMGKSILGVEKNSLLAFTKDPTKFENDLDASIAGIMDALRFDPLLGLTQIIARIRFLLDDELASIERKIQLVCVLSKLALHSASSCEDIMSCEGLIDNLYKEIFKITWPLLDHGIEAEYLCALLRLVKFLCLSSKEATIAFKNLGFFQSLMRFVSILSADSKPLFGVQFQVFGLLNICLSYGVSASILDEFHPIIFQNGEYLLNAVNFMTHNAAIVKAAVSWINFLNESLLLFRNHLNPGGEDDAFYPFVDIASRFLNILVTKF